MNPLLMTATIPILLFEPGVSSEPIKIYTSNQETITDTVWFYQSETISISCDDGYTIQTINDLPIDASFTNYTITEDTTSVVITYVNEEGLSYEKRVNVERISLPELELPFTNDAYISEDFSFECQDSSSEVVLLSQGQESIYPCNGNISIHLTEDGDYSIYVRSKDHPSIVGESVSFHFSNQQIQVQLNPIVENGTATFQVFTQGHSLNGYQLYIDGQWVDPLYALTIEEGTEKSFYVEVLLTDLYGHQAYDAKTVYIDRKAPVLTLVANGEPMSSIFRGSDLYSYDYLVNESYTMNITYVVNEKRREGNILEIFQSMRTGDVLKANFDVYDDSMNHSFYTFTFYKEMKPETLSVLDYQNGEFMLRDYNINPQAQLTFSQVPKTVQSKNIAPIRLYRKGKNKVVIIIDHNQVYKVKSIKINNKKIPIKKLKKDKFGNYTYTFELKKNTKIKIKALDRNKQVMTFHKKIKWEQKKEMTSFWQRILSIFKKQ